MKYLKNTLGVSSLILLLLVFACSRDEPAQVSSSAAGKVADTMVTSVNPDEARAIAKQAYVYGFPMVMNYKTLYNYVIDKSGPEYKGPFNELACDARLFTPDDKAVVTPNSDTPYCMFWIDLRTEPLVLSVPEMEPERFYHFQLIDLYTHNFAYVGTLTSGNGAGSFLLAGPGWNGEKPEGITEVIRSETNFIFSVTRTQLFGPDDLPKVKQIQDSYVLQPLSTFLGEEKPASAQMPDWPVWVEGAQFDERFFSYFTFMLSLLETPGEGEKTLWANLARLGIKPGHSFDIDAQSAEMQQALKAGVKEGFSDIEKFIATHSSDPLLSARIFGTRTYLSESARNFKLETPSLLRSVAAQTGLYGNSAAEAIYPTYIFDTEGKPYDASVNKFTLTFNKGQLPPVKAFWSLTMYDGKTQLFIDNALDRYLLNSSMLDEMKLEKDGSLVLYIAKQSPGADLESNWLPAPNGPFYMVLRLYGPEPEALEGKWRPPVLQKLD